jgi:hypothetical protein
LESNEIPRARPVSFCRALIAIKNENSRATAVLSSLGVILEQKIDLFFFEERRLSINSAIFYLHLRLLRALHTFLHFSFSSRFATLGASPSSHRKNFREMSTPFLFTTFNHLAWLSFSSLANRWSIR